jgi:hypothetical protein
MGYSDLSEVDNILKELSEDNIPGYAAQYTNLHNIKRNLQKFKAAGDVIYDLNSSPFGLEHGNSKLYKTYDSIRDMSSAANKHHLYVNGINRKVADKLPEYLKK